MGESGPRGCLYAVIGLAAVFGIAKCMADQQGPSTGPSCMERLERLERRFDSTEFERIQKECRPERSYPR